ncbi:VWA-like domain-containing protein [Pararhodobacter sp. SW119]|uniref:vWA domain-containing protein n=1 Tax=Pararhodobacter sp. SW119 TaxID=2780075 RepID=UPI001ADFD849|nr:VWA-like domain-containing protein [Pararhodobacter sp. SW119]
MSRHSRRATAALRALTEVDPALSALALWCRHRDADLPDVPAETEGSEIRYGAAFEALALHEQIGLAGHHVLHVSLQHSARMADMALRLGERFDAELWQIACDAITNDVILAAGHALPRPAVTLSGLLDRLGAGNAKDGAPHALAEWDCERLYHLLAQAPDGAGGARRYAQDQGLRADLRAEEGVGSRARGAGEDAGQENDGAEWRTHLARALALGRAAGFGLGAISLRLADLPRSRTPWEVVLRRLLARATVHRPEPNPFRPARSWLAQTARALQDGGAPPPWQPRQMGLVRQPRLVLALDCSGSIAPDAVGLLLAEVTGVTRRMQGALHLLVFDEQIRIDRPLDPASWQTELRSLALPEGGGTDFAPVLARAAALSPSALVILTDMDGPIGACRPRFPVIWAAPQPDPPSAPFGRVLSLAR